MADKQLAKKGKSGVDNTFRRTWDKDDFTDKAAKREKEVSSAECRLIVCVTDLLLTGLQPSSLLTMHVCCRKRTLRRAHLTSRKGDG